MSNSDFYSSSSSTITVEVFRRGLKPTLKVLSGTALKPVPSPSISISSSAADGLLSFGFFRCAFSAFPGVRVLFRPARETRPSLMMGGPFIGVADFAPSSVTPFLKSETTCCSLFEAYACRFRGAYAPPAILVSKYLSNTPWRPEFGFWGCIWVHSLPNQ